MFLKGSPIDFNVAVDTSQLVVDFQRCKSVLLNQLTFFTIDTKDNSGQGEVKVVITSEIYILCKRFFSSNKKYLKFIICTNKDPSGTHIQPKSINSKNNVWRVEFNPIEIGMSSLFLK